MRTYKKKEGKWNFKNQIEVEEEKKNGNGTANVCWRDI